MSTPDNRLRSAVRRSKPLGGWLAGVAAAIVATLVAAWLLTDKPDQPTGEPFTVVVRPLHGGVNGEGWIATGPQELLPARPSRQDDWESWVRQTGAVPHSTTEVDLVVQGRSAAQVTLLDLRVRVVGRHPAVSGTLFELEGGDPGAFRAVTVDLDTEPPTLGSFFDDHIIPGNVPAYERQPIRFPYRVSLSDAETFEVVAHANTCDCEWVIELTWAAEGRTGTKTIDDAGKPFRLSGGVNVTTHCAVGDRELCQPGPPERIP
jgi:hypothetical protein